MADHVIRNLGVLCGSDVRGQPVRDTSSGLSEPAKVVLAIDLSTTLDQSVWGIVRSRVSSTRFITGTVKPITDAELAAVVQKAVARAIKRDA